VTGEDAIPAEPDVTDIRTVADGIELDLFLPEALACFQGHFPGYAVLPGVTQIDWAVQYADRYLGTEIGGARRFQVKFRAIVRPGGPLTLRLIRPAGAGRLLFEFRQGDDIRSSGSIVLGDGS
jgi:3-hydroxymyristoyl/3-hydroxydecanoyl-(acyl carrier protein) dehydratase